MTSRRARRKARTVGPIKCPECGKSCFGLYEKGQPVQCYHCGHEWDTVECCWQCGRPWGNIRVKKEKRQRRAGARTIKVKVRV